MRPLGWITPSGVDPRPLTDQVASDSGGPYGRHARGWPLLVQIVVLAIVYYVAGRLGLAAGALKGNVTPIWPPTGISIAVLMLLGYRLWPGVAAGALLVNALTTVPTLASIGMATGNTLEALAGAYLLHRAAHGRLSFDRVRDVVALTLLAAGLATTASATIGVTSLRLGGVIPTSEMWPSWRMWWVGDALGALVVTPAVLATWPRRGASLWGRRPAERALLLIGIAGLTTYAFSGKFDHVYVLFPPLIFAALRLQLRGAAVATLLVSIIATVGTRAGHGAFVNGNPTRSLWMLDTFLGVAALTVLILCAVVSERDRASAQNVELTDTANHDPLTGLLNRRGFEVELDRQTAYVSRNGEAGSLLLLDLDRFKQINDSLGHTAGDQLIVAIAGLLRRTVRATDVVSRLGGDEFAVLLPRGGQEEAEAVAGKLLHAIRHEVTMLAGQHPRTITVSIGIALFDDQNLTAEDVLIGADVSLYDAKDMGRDCFVTCSSGRSTRTPTNARLGWVERITNALREDRLVLHAQPILDLRTNTVRRHELLVRMLDDDDQLIGPATFLHIAERCGLMTMIDRWVTAQAIALLAHPDLPEDVVLEVNLSGLSVGDEGMLSHLEERLAVSGADPSRLVLEITETAAVADMGRARTFVERLTAIGCQFAIDDFGAGFGSFYYLKHLEFDYIKIDGEFITNCITNQTDQLVVDSLVNIARGLGKKTIAEFVGDIETLEFLREHGVDFAQGYGIGMPVPIESVLGTRSRAAAHVGD